MTPTLTVLMTVYHGTTVEELERSLASITGQTRPPEEFLVVSDARRKEVFWARFDRTGRRLSGPEVSAPATLPPLPLAGPGAHLVGEVSGPDGLDAGWLAAAELPDAGLEPLYLRRPDAEVPTRVKSALPAPRLSLRRAR